MKPQTVPIASPCKRQCHLVDGGCPACGRSLQEIQNWLLYTPERRASIMAFALPGRLELRSSPLPVIDGGQRLGSAHTMATLTHLMALSADDRRARFGHTLSDEALARFVAALDWGGQWLWGIMENEHIVALAHLSPPVSDEAWELAVSVLPSERARGLGRQLLNAAREVAGAVAPGGVLMMRGSAQNPALQRLARTGSIHTSEGELSVHFPL
jgi:predicted Fe-S protein YdhL (DUF1289 family)/GNAT superfamily N-acetyltransferase